MAASGFKKGITPSRARLKAYLESELKKDFDLSSLTAAELLALKSETSAEIKKVEKLVETIQKHHDRWTTFLAPLVGETLAQETANFDAYYAEEDYLDLVASAEDRLIELRQVISDLNVSAEIQGMQAVGNQAAHVPARALPFDGSGDNPHFIRLPTLNLPTFEGDYRDWRAFFDTFNGTVGSSTIAPVQKLYYLRNSLKGRPLELIQGLALNNENYECAMQRLINAFGKDHLVKETLFSTLEQLPKANQNVQCIRQTIDQINSILIQLMQMAEDTSTEEAKRKEINTWIILHTVQKKFHTDTLLEVENRKTDDSWSTLSLMEALDAHTIQKEQLSRIKTMHNSGMHRQTDHTSQKVPENINSNFASQQNSKKSRSNTRYGNSADAFSTQTLKGRKNDKKSNQSAMRPCLFCEGAHKDHDCSTYSNPQMRRERVMATNKCFVCLGPHFRRNCSSKKTCFRCKGNHHQLLCISPDSRYGPDASSSSTACSVTTMDVEKANTGYGDPLMCANAPVSNPMNTKSSSALLFFDSGASRCFISESLAAKLKLEPVDRETLTVATFSNKATKTIESSVVRFNLRLMNGNDMLIQANTVRRLGVQIFAQPLEAADKSEIDRMREPVVTPTPNQPEMLVPDILIGNDVFIELIRGQPRGLPSGKSLLPTKVGLLLGGLSKLQGPTLEWAGLNSHHVMIMDDAVAPEITGVPDVEQMWSLARVGISDEPGRDEDKEAVQQFLKGVHYTPEGRISSPFIWNSEEPQLPDNRAVAFKRTSVLVRKLAKDPVLMQRYDQTIQDQLKEGIIERVTNQAGKVIHYLPHRHVVNGKKLRVVFDASARESRKSNSLNDCLLKGPLLLPDIVAIQMRWRTYETLLTCDIKHAFHCLELNKEDRDATRFFWCKDLNKPNLEGNFEVFRFRRILFGATCSPYILGAALEYHFKSVGTPLATDLMKNLYCDNCLYAIKPEDDPKTLYQNIKDLFGAVKMDIREFASNNQEFMDAVRPEDRLPSGKIKILGIVWTPNDELEIRAPVMTQGPPTKRKVLASIASVYDPMGLIIPVMLSAKLFLQRLWLKSKQWDEPLSEQEQQEWIEISKVLMEIPEIRIPRWIPQNEKREAELLVFADASGACFGACAFLKISIGQTVSVRLLMAKNRLSPKNKELKIPRKELLGLLCAARMTKFCHSNLDITITGTYIFTDSEISLFWLKSQKTLPIFVSNRIREIKEIGDLFNIIFCHVSSQDNAADILSRGMPPKELEQSQLWWVGAPWLKKQPEFWPTRNIDNFICADIKEDDEPIYVMTAGETEAALPSADTVVDPSRFSSLTKLKRSVGYVLRFLKQKLTNSINSPSTGTAKVKAFKAVLATVTSEGEITAADLEAAEFLMVRKEQEQLNWKEYERLKLFKDHKGLVRCEGRLGKSQLPYGTRYPILLLKESQFTTLLVRHFHEKAIHAGTNHTLVLIRESYWIPRGRQLIKKVINACVHCKIVRHRGFQLPQIPSLPETRVNQRRPFDAISLDYAGFFLVKNDKDITKVYISVVTCHTIRAVHLEVVNDLSGEQFLQGFRRFVARRGCPSVVFSDNGTQYVVAGKVFDGIPAPVADPDVLSYFANHGVSWNYSTQYAPWGAGVVESMVGLTKFALKRGVGKRILPLSAFTTYVTEVESFINSRPLGPVTDEFDVVTCNDFIVPMSHHTAFPVEAEMMEEERFQQNNAEKLLDLWCLERKLVERAWYAWSTHYLPSLRDKTQWDIRQKGPTIKRTPEVGELVLVSPEETLTKVGTWHRAKVVKLHPGTDGAVRSATVISPTGKLYKRPVSSLSPLEITAETPPPVQPAAEPTAPDRDPIATRTRSKGLSKVLTTMVIFLALVGNTLANECPKAKDRILIESQRCVNKGWAVYQLNDGQLCGGPVNCSSGQHLDGNGGCSSVCNCPRWADGCTYSFKPPRGTPLASNPRTAIKTIRPTQICARRPKPECESQKVTRSLQRVQLEDGSKHFVSRLDLQTVEPTVDDFHCVGSGITVGSKKYCNEYNCADTGSRYCYYKDTSVTLIDTDEGSVPIWAWGRDEETFYPFKRSKPKASCARCSLRCRKGGVVVTLPPGAGTVEVCAHPFCSKVAFPRTREEIVLPTEVVLRPYKVKAKIWIAGRVARTLEVTCDAAAYCESLTCIICMDRLYNSHCAPYLTLLLVGLIIYFGSGTLLALLKILGFFCKGTRCLLRGLQRCTITTGRCCGKLCRCTRRKMGRAANKCRLPDSDSDSEGVPLVMTGPSTETRTRGSTTGPASTGPPRRYKSLFAGRTIQAIAMISLLGVANGCGESATLNADRSHCTESPDGGLSCSITEVIRLALSPQGQDSCLLITSGKGDPIGTLTIEVEGVRIECLKRSQYFTRSFEMKSQGVKKCPGAGSCSGQKCGGIRTDSKVDELAGEANSYPGFTHCTDSPGCAGGGCFLCSSACLFWRTYAFPLSSTIYEAFDCPTWRYKLEATARLLLQGEPPKIKKLALYPGETAKWDQLEIGVISVTRPPIPILSTAFLTDGKRTMAIRVSEAGQPIAGQVGSLQCSTMEKARQFRCFLPSDLCQCEPRDSKVFCSCHGGSLEKAFEDLDKVLPLNLEGLNLEGHGDGVVAEYRGTAALELQLNFHGYRFALRSHHTTCSLDILDLRGCYSCLSGAMASFVCTTEVGEALAHVACGDAHFSTLCRSEGHSGTSYLHFQVPEVDLECEVRCPAGSTKAELRGTLVYIEASQINTGSNLVTGSFAPDGLSAIMRPVTRLLSSWRQVGVAIIAVILLIVSVCLFPSLLAVLKDCLENCRRKKRQ